MNILIAEDEVISRLMTVKALEQLGHRCVAVSDGNEAWELFQRERFDVVISDWMMPGLDGVELCRRVRAGEQLRYTYFIILTALADREYRVAGMQAGADDHLAKPLDRDELVLRLIAAERVTQLHRKLEAQALELERLNRELFDAGRRDPLTGIANRRRMQEDLLAFEAAISEGRTSLSVALFDIDHFKRYNDTYLHLAGDEVLRVVAAVLSQHIAPHDGIYRFGGEEFLVVIRQPMGAASATVERMRAAIEACAIAHAASPDAPVLTVSAGIAEVSGPAGEAFIAAIRAADEALLRAKREGRNRVVVAG
jgi:diguanylate cyclase (GGDEF)-like protein